VNRPSAKFQIYVDVAAILLRSVTVNDLLMASFQCHVISSDGQVFLTKPL
jgi:hypothetical protein